MLAAVKEAIDKRQQVMVFVLFLVSFIITTALLFFFRSLLSCCLFVWRASFVSVEEGLFHGRERQRSESSILGKTQVTDIARVPMSCFALQYPGVRKMLTLALSCEGKCDHERGEASSRAGRFRGS